MRKDLVLIGGGSHAFSILDMLIRNKPKYQILGYVDNQRTSLPLRYLGDDRVFAVGRKQKKEDMLLVSCIGINMPVRKNIFKFFKARGYSFLTYIHPSAIIGTGTEFGEGSIIFPGVIIGVSAEIGDNVCVHSNSVIEHETMIARHSYISPGVSIAGNCAIGESSFVGLNAGISQGVQLKENTVVGAGAIVLKSFNETNIKLLGIPAKISKR